MDIYIYVSLFVFISILGLGVSIILKYSRKKKLSPDQKHYFQNIVKKILHSDSYKEQIIDFDKLYHKILLSLGYKGSFGEILKSCPNEVGDIELIWRLHKIRNKLVHDFIHHDDKELKTNVMLYKKEIQFLLQQI